MALVGNWNYPTSIRFGAGRIKELPDACKFVGFRRPLLVTDPGLAKLTMISDAMLDLRKAGLEVALFSEVKPNPVAANVEAGVRVGAPLGGGQNRRNNSKCDRCCYSVNGVRNSVLICRTVIPIGHPVK